MITQGRVLGISVALNLALAIVAGYQYFKPSTGADSATQNPKRARIAASDAIRVRTFPTSDYELRSEVARLHALGLSAEETMPLIVDLIKRRVAATTPPSASNYWASEWESVSQDLVVARARQNDAIRAALLSVYGPDAERAAPLREIFRPLEPIYPFLSPTEQRALERFRLTRAAPAPRRANSGSGSMVPADHSDFMASLPPELSAASAFELALRESPLAARLRAAHADLTEAEFRALFAAIADAERNHVPVPLDIAGGKVPRAKVLKVVTQTDPAWHGLQSAAMQSALPERRLIEVYEVVRETNGSVASLMRTGGSSMPDRGARITELMRSRDRRIAQLVGEQVAASLLNALNDTYRSLALRSSQPEALNMPAQ